MHVDFTPKGICPSRIQFDIDENDKTLHNIEFTGGCNGNLKAIGKLCEGKSAKEVADIVRGNTCGLKKTSCADQLSIAIDEALAEM
ncbi:MAG: TIGR03905 family TSCPD domain-containing protein [Firmicutes bacterium]|nr:TIGR03905 family TSCPD domain-containing protein [Bacillota bacterium]